MDVSGVAPNQAQLLIDEKIAEHQKAIQLLNRDRNAQSLVARLPPEVLGNIFAIASSTARQEGRSSLLSRQFNFSYVSEHWRDVALTTPEIWGNLPQSNLKWCTVMLERSKTTDLTFDFFLREFDSERGKLVKEVLVNHAYRLKVLRIHSTSTKDDDAEPILDLLPNSAPRLQSLSLCFDSLARAALIPDASFADASLSILELSGCAFNWKTSLLVGLRQLKIRGRACSSPSHLLYALRSMPLLTHLEAERAFLADGLAFDTLQVSLPHLLNFDISACTTTAVANILRFLVIPRSATVHLALSSRANSNSPWSSLVPALSTFFASMTGVVVGAQVAPAFRTLSIEKSYRGYLIGAWCKVWQPPTSAIRYGSEIPPLLSLHVDSSDDNLLPQLLSAIPLSNISVLSVSLGIKITTLISTFGDHPKIKTIVTHGGASQVVSAMMHRKDETEASYNHPPFPRLENLIMTHIVFKKKKNTAYITRRRLVNCLIERVERGAPIQKLAISGAYELYQNDVHVLEEIVPTVEWDEEEQEYEESTTEEDDYYDRPF